MIPDSPSDAVSALARDLAAARTVREAEAAIERRLRSMPSGPRPSAPAVAPATAPTIAPAPEVIGIWRRVPGVNGVEYVRDATLDDDNFWSRAERIGPRTRSRVVLLGESVARGAFVDPLFTCASALQDCFEARRPGQIEIVDLARNGLTAPRLLQMTAEALALAPDAIVLFAGNNWLLQPSAIDRAGLASAIETGASWGEVGRFFREALRRQVADLLFALAETARPARVPLLFVIPTNNARDSRGPSEWHNPLLSTAEQSQIEEELATAETLLAAGEYDGAGRLAARVADRDVVNVRARQIRAECALAAGDKAAAAQWFGEADDARLYVPLMGLLPCGPTLSAAIREAAAAEGVATIDLRDVFLRAQDGVPPGRELFLDQVHMTPLGIRLAMAAVADRLWPMLGHAAGAGDLPVDVPMSIDPAAAAQGHFMAALLHGAVDDAELAAYHAREAVRHEREMAPLMRSLVRMMLSGAPGMYHEAFARVAQAAERFPGLRLALYRIPAAAAQPVYIELPRALAAAAETVVPGAIDECEQFLRETVLREGRRVSLLRYVRQRTDAAAWSGREPCYVRSFRRRTEFLVRCGEPRDLDVAIVARTGPDCEGDAAAALLVNGRLAHRWQVGPAWSRTTCTIPASLLGDGDGDGDGAADGVIEMAILWADPGLDRTARARAVTGMFRAGALDGAGFPTTLYTVYGEVFSLDVTCSTRGAPMMLQDGQLHRYDEDGFLLLPDCFSGEEVEIITREWDLLRTRDLPGQVKERDQQTIRSLYGAHTCSDVMDRVARHPRLVGPVRQILGDDLYVHQFKINSKAAFAGDLWPWHQDYIYWQAEDGMRQARVVTAALFLDDVNEFNGPLLFVPQSHRAGVIRPPARQGGAGWQSHVSADLTYTVSHDVLERLVETHGIVSPKGRRGSVLLFHGNVVHGSASNMSPFPRKMLLVTFNAVSNALPPADSPRPAFLASRDFTPIVPVDDDALTSLVLVKGTAHS